MKGLSNGVLHVMFYSFPHLFHAVTCVQHFCFMRNSGYPYSPKRYIVEQNRARFFWPFMPGLRIA